jgi:hypothetical protein
MKLTDLSILEVRILKHLYCQNPHRDFDDPGAAFKYCHGLEMTSTDGMKLRLYLTGIRTGSDLRRRLNPGVCIPGGTLSFIHSQLQAPKILPDTRMRLPDIFRRSFHDAVRALIARELITGFSAGYEIAEGEDGFRAPVPARWSGEEAERVVGVTLTKAGFAGARELIMQLAEEGD